MGGRRLNKGECLTGPGGGPVFILLKVCRRAVRMLLVKCYDIKMVKLPECSTIGAISIKKIV